MNNFLRQVNRSLPPPVPKRVKPHTRQPIKEAGNVTVTGRKEKSRIV